MNIKDVAKMAGVSISTISRVINQSAYVSPEIKGRIEKILAETAVSYTHLDGYKSQTPDGTGVRDYIHVVDLAEGHVAALNYLGENAGLLAVNLGTGCGYSVLDMVRAFEKASGRPVPYALVPRRPGDIAACYADPALATKLLGWQAKRGIDAMCRDAWRWQQNQLPK